MVFTGVSAGNTRVRGKGEAENWGVTTHGDLLTANDVRAARFDKPPLGKRGYNEDQVDEFLEHVIARLEGRNAMTVADVRNVRFSKPKWGRRGYAEDEVDRLLARVARTVEALGR